jgi:hypothetical protein
MPYKDHNPQKSPARRVATPSNINRNQWVIIPKASPIVNLGKVVLDKYIFIEIYITCDQIYLSHDFI